MIAQNNIFYAAEQYIVQALSADEQLSACVWLEENRKDIDYEIKSALGKQGIVGMVVVDRGDFIGNHSGGEIAWECAAEIDIVENPQVNRTRPAAGDCNTAQDFAVRAADVLCAPKYGNAGKFQLVSVETGEEENLLVAKTNLKFTLYADAEPSDYLTLAETAEILRIVNGKVVSENTSVSAELSALADNLEAAYAAAAEKGAEIPAETNAANLPAAISTIETVGLSTVAEISSRLSDGISSVRSDLADRMDEISAVYATKAELEAAEDALTAAQNGMSAIVSSDYLTKTEAAGIYPNQGEVDELIQASFRSSKGYTDTYVNILSGAIGEISSDYATKTELWTAIGDIDTILNAMIG